MEFYNSCICIDYSFSIASMFTNESFKIFCFSLKMEQKFIECGYTSTDDLNERNTVQSENFLVNIKNQKILFRFWATRFSKREITSWLILESSFPFQTWINVPLIRNKIETKDKALHKENSSGGVINNKSAWKLDVVIREFGH